MTNPTPHRATPEQWANVEQWAPATGTPNYSSCLLELRDRLAAAEQQLASLAGKPPKPCPHIRSGDEGTSYCALAEATANLRQQDEDAERAAEPAVVGSLLSPAARDVMDAMRAISPAPADELAAAALRALAAQVTPVSTNRRQNEIRAEILRIADELEGADG